MKPIPQLSLPPVRGSILYVDQSTGADTYSGKSFGRAMASLQSAVDAVDRAGSLIVVAPGQYDETVTIARSAALAGLQIIGLGGRGAAYIEPSTEDAGGLVCHADDVSIENLGVAGEDETSAKALTVTGSRFRAHRCKFEGGLTQLAIGPGTVAQEAADTHGRGADFIFTECEFAWGTNGVVLTATDFGAVTQGLFSHCRFHNLTAASFEETGGSAAVRFQNIVIDQCIFDTIDDGTVPTKWISLNDDNANTGIVSRCVFPTAINSGKNLCSTKMLWIGNVHTGGIAAAQPS